VQKWVPERPGRPMGLPTFFRLLFLLSLVAGSTPARALVWKLNLEKRDTWQYKPPVFIPVIPYGNPRRARPRALYLRRM
jgi:hypothetical protein